MKKEKNKKKENKKQKLEKCPAPIYARLETKK